MLKLKRIAITGGIASGKTSVCRIFQDLGAFVVSTDAIVHEFLLSDAALQKQIVGLFGPNVLQDGHISRQRIAERVFKDPRQLRALEKILHPAVFHKIEELYAAACRLGEYTLFVVEIPLLFEVEGESFYDVVVAVYADESVARLRFKQAGFKAEDYDQRMERQLEPYHKAGRAHYTIQNNGSLKDLEQQVVSLNINLIHQR